MSGAPPSYEEAFSEKYETKGPVIIQPSAPYPITTQPSAPLSTESP